ncbi:3-oxoacyl-[acyl-carrier-protein] synthase III C-terminal domain-containing protein [Streptomyces sp. NPDC048219]|uniref:3-oxoacyl-[acyl-carrier-protein] synthase III C-terminal domain-containing protein n=1 Tax=unclassified Streptomyces TaxID=2593676 RepID=UPI003436F7E3
MDAVGLVCVHQPSVPFLHVFCNRVDIRPDSVWSTFPRIDQAACATLPLPLALAAEQHRLRPGAKVALFGLPKRGRRRSDAPQLVATGPWAAPRYVLHPDREGSPLSLSKGRQIEQPSE